MPPSPSAVGPLKRKRPTQPVVSTLDASVEDFHLVLETGLSHLWDEVTSEMGSEQRLDLLKNLLDAALSVSVHTEIIVRADGTELASAKAEDLDPEDHTLGGLLGPRIDNLISAIVAYPAFGDAAGNLGAGGVSLFAQAAALIAMSLRTCTDELERIRKYNDREGTERGSAIDSTLLRLAAAGATFTMEPCTEQPARFSFPFPRWKIRRTATPTPT